MGHVSIDALVNTGRRVAGLARKLEADIEARRFARFADGRLGPIVANHPAFVYGHLALYPAFVSRLLGLNLDIAPPQAWGDLFGAGRECKDDPDGSIYPDRDEILDRYHGTHEALLDAMSGVDPAKLAEPGPNERAPTVLAAVDFMIGGHAMFHLGQVSTWRRIEGLGSAL